MKYWMYVSLWGEHGGAPGLGLYSADAQTGELQLCRRLNDHLSFGCSTVDQRRRMLYICNETERVFGAPCETGRVYGYAINPANGELTERFQRDTYCPNPSYFSLDSSGEFAVISHIGGGAPIANLGKEPDGKVKMSIHPRNAYLELYSVEKDGTLGELLDIKAHKADPASRFPSSMLHCAVFDPSGKLLAVCDKGSGLVYFYRLNRKRGELELLNQAVTDIPGAQPRYCVFHPTQPYFVVNHEKLRDGQLLISSFRYTENGELERISVVDVLPEGYSVPPRSHFEQQGLCISSDGTYVYTCLKDGPNGICVLALNSDGSLRVEGYQAVEGDWPRGLAIMPGGNYLVSSCLASGHVASYAINGGSLHPVCTAEKLQGAAYLSFFPQK
ncbi:MAG: lactonase family protein [Oscillospiraceae bacterium]|nr:lactonase family protein [Oscillospiraceae bacterium]